MPGGSEEWTGWNGNFPLALKEKRKAGMDSMDTIDGYDERYGFKPGEAGVAMVAEV